MASVLTRKVGKSSLSSDKGSSSHGSDRLCADGPQSGGSKESGRHYERYSKQKLDCAAGY